MGRYYSESPNVIIQQRCIFEVVGSCCCAWTVPTGITEATFEVWGGGGSGAPKCCCYCGGGSGGFGGGYALKTATVVSGDTYTLCAAPGGAMLYCSVSGVNTGCSGGTSYATGTNLSNLCAVGGGGGVWCCNAGACVSCGGQSYGGDVCLYGGVGWSAVRQSWPCNMSLGGPSPFGGGYQMFHSQMCLQACSPGYYGIFPGGGGTGQSANCCDCCVCNGPGAAGLVRVTF